MENICLNVNWTVGSKFIVWWDVVVLTVWWFFVLVKGGIEQM